MTSLGRNESLIIAQSLSFNVDFDSITMDTIFQENEGFLTTRLLEPLDSDVAGISKVATILNRGLNSCTLHLYQVIVVFSGLFRK